ncbi:MAG: PHP domain-containing protein, partial [bacterium]
VAVLELHAVVEELGAPRVAVADLPGDALEKRGEGFGFAAHGAKHLHRHEMNRDKKTQAHDSLSFAHFEAMHRLKARFIEDFESYRLQYDYQQTADKFRLYHDENGIDRRALVDDLLSQEGMTQHYRNNILGQTIAESEKMVNKPGYFGKKMSRIALKYLITGNLSQAHLRDAGLLMFKSGGKIMRNNKLSLLARLTAPHITTSTNEIALDIHVHTISSFDGTSNMETLILKAVERGLDAIAITDHDNYDEVYIALKETERLKNAGKIPQDFIVIPGQEVSTREGHILALFIQSYIPTELTASETIAEIHRQGGLAIAPHPMEPRFGLGKQVEKLPLDGMVLTGATVSELYRSAGLAKRVRARMAIFMDTDAHSEDAVAWSGYTIVKTADSSPEGIRAAIRNRQTRPVYRKTIQALLSATQRPIIRQWFAPVSFYHASKEKVEDVLSNVLLADAIEVETLVESPLEQITDLIGLPKYLQRDGMANFRRKHIIKRVKIDYGKLRIIFNTGGNANFQFRYKFAWLPGHG